MAGNTAVAKQTETQDIMLRKMLNSDAYKDKFKEVLGDRAAGFISSIIALSSANGMLKNAEPNSIISAAMMAATLDLPINANFGFAYVVPYKDYKQNDQVFAQFQLGYKGMIQLAFRSGMYLTINADMIYEGEIYSTDRVSGQLRITGAKTSDTVVAYFAYFKMTNGFEKSVVMTKTEMEKHAQKYSKSYDSPKGSIWKSNFNEMAMKTVLRRLIGRFGAMSVQMQQAYTADQAVIKEVKANGEMPEVDYVDNEGFVDVEVTKIPTVSHEQMANLLKTYGKDAVETSLATLGFETLESLSCDNVEEFEEICKAHKQDKQPDKKAAEKAEPAADTKGKQDKAEDKKTDTGEDW